MFATYLSNVYLLASLVQTVSQIMYTHFLLQILEFANLQYQNTICNLIFVKY